MTSNLKDNIMTSDMTLDYVDEKEPITAAKTHGGSSWSSTQVKVEKLKDKRTTTCVWSL